MKWRTLLVATLAVALASTATEFAAAPAFACRYATPGSLDEVATQYPVVVVGRPTSAGLVDGQLAYELAVDEVILGGAPSIAGVSFGGHSCNDIQPDLVVGRSYLLMLAPSYTSDVSGGKAAFNGSPFAAFEVSADTLVSAARLEAPFVAMVEAAGRAGLRGLVQGHSRVAAPWTALSTPDGDIGYEIQGDPAGLLARPAVQDLVEGYRRAAVVHVVAVTTSNGLAPGSLRSTVYLQVDRWVAGSQPKGGRKIRLQQEGGRVAGSTWEDPDRPLPRPGQSYLVFDGCRRCPGANLFRIRGGFVWALSPAWLDVPAVRELHGLPLAGAVAAILRARIEAAAP